MTHTLLQPTRTTQLVRSRRPRTRSHGLNCVLRARLYPRDHTRHALLAARGDMLTSLVALFKIEYSMSESRDVPRRVFPLVYIPPSLSSSFLPSPFFRDTGPWLRYQHQRSLELWTF
jgi:hypothetical protein